ncbi:hypothetical protein Tco_0866845 [Tanacetum coccineum]
MNQLSYLSWPPGIFLERLLPHARCVRFKSLYEGFPSWWEFVRFCPSDASIRGWHRLPCSVAQLVTWMAIFLGANRWVIRSAGDLDGYISGSEQREREREGGRIVEEGGMEGRGGGRKSREGEWWWGRIWEGGEERRWGEGDWEEREKVGGGRGRGGG